MKISQLVFSVCFILVLAAVGMNAAIPMRNQKPHKPLTFSMKKISDSTEPQKNIKDGMFCPTCIDVLDFALADLTAAVDAGVFSSCYKLCNVIAGSGTYAWEGCNIICDVIGVNVFIDVIKKADLDPIYGCQLANICPVRDCTAKRCASFMNSGFIPSSIQHGAPTSFYAGLQVFNSTGPGEVIFTLTGAFTTENIIYRYYQAGGYTQGTYSIRFNVSTKDDDAKALEWMPGLYTAVVDVCEGVCGAAKPHTRLLAETKANFTLTNSPFSGK